MRGEFEVRKRNVQGEVVEDWQRAQNTMMLLWLTTAAERLYRTDVASPLFYFIPIALGGFTALSNADTMASHAGWAEVAGGAYADADRLAWTPNAAATQSISNTGAEANLLAAADVSIHALGLSTDDTKNGTAGILVASAVLTQDKILETGESLDMRYTLNMA